MGGFVTVRLIELNVCIDVWPTMGSVERTRDEDGLREAISPVPSEVKVSAAAWSIYSLIFADMVQPRTAHP